MDEIHRSLQEAIEREVLVAFRAGYREGRNSAEEGGTNWTVAMLQECDNRSYAWLHERQ